jgi:hypothetical protein
MITFACPGPACGQRYTVSSDKLGKKAKCRRCGTLIQVKSREEPEWLDDEQVQPAPSASPAMPRLAATVREPVTQADSARNVGAAFGQITWVHLRSAAVVVLGIACTLALFHKTAWRMLPYPSQQEMETRLLATLPPGHMGFKVAEYSPSKKMFVFDVTYHEAGDFQGTDFRVAYFDWDVSWSTSVEAKRWVVLPGHHSSTREHLKVYVGRFSDTGRLVEEEAKLTLLSDTPIARQRATQIAQAVAQSL